MTAAVANSVSADRPLRLWPGVFIVALFWACLKLPGIFIPGETMQFFFVFFGPMVLTVLFLVWWLFFSRARWADRGFGLGVAILLGAGAWFTFHPTLKDMGLMMFAIPVVTTAWVGWLLVTQVLWGLGWAFSSGADVAWLTDELGQPGRIDGTLTARARW